MRYDDVCDSVLLSYAFLNTLTMRTAFPCIPSRNDLSLNCRYGLELFLRSAGMQYRCIPAHLKHWKLFKKTSWMRLALTLNTPRRRLCSVVLFQNLALAFSYRTSMVLLECHGLWTLLAGQMTSSAKLWMACGKRSPRFLNISQKCTQYCKFILDSDIVEVLKFSILDKASDVKPW